MTRTLSIVRKFAMGRHRNVSAASLAVAAAVLVITINAADAVVDAIAADSACPDLSWHLSGDKCYKLFDETSESWPDSEGLCETWGTLANILSNNTNTLLESLLTSAGHDAAWIGLTNIGHADWYGWTDTHTEPEYTAWADGMPTNVSCSGVILTRDGSGGGGGGGEGEGGGGARWEDRWMFETWPRLCQAPAGSWATSGSPRRNRRTDAASNAANVLC